MCAEGSEPLDLLIVPGLAFTHVGDEGGYVLYVLVVVGYVPGGILYNSGNPNPNPNPGGTRVVCPIAVGKVRHRGVRGTRGLDFFFFFFLFGGVTRSRVYEG